MSSLLKSAALAGAVIFAAMPSMASAVTITFDDLAEGAVVTNQYAALGATFVANAFTGPGSSSSGSAWATNTDMHVSATDVGAFGTPSLVSGKVLHAFGGTYSPGWLGEDGDPSFFINFSTAINSFSAAFAGVSGGPDTRIFVYNGATLLGTVGGPATTTGQFVLSFSAASITRVAVAAGSFDDWVGVDNVTFTPVAAGGVPEPASWALMIGGFGLVGGAMRRRAAKASVSFA